MPEELECKLAVAEHDSIREKLRAAGAEYVGSVLETNCLYDKGDASLRDAHCGLRVRTIRVTDGKGPTHSLTFKGPRREGPFKRREEIESGVEDPEAVGQILGALGFWERLLFEKRRESWRLASCKIELDEIPVLGTYVEVEGPSEEAVRAALGLIGLADGAVEPSSYIGLLVDRGGDAIGETCEFRFDT